MRRHVTSAAIPLASDISSWQKYSINMRAESGTSRTGNGAQGQGFFSRGVLTIADIGILIDSHLVWTMLTRNQPG